MARTKCQLQIRIRLTRLNLTSCRLLPRSPRNTLTARIRRSDFNGAACKPIAKYRAHIVPDLIGVEAVCEVDLRDVGLEQAVLHGSDFQRNAAGCGVDVEDFAVGRVFGDGVLLANAAAYGPEVDWFVALVRYDCAADGLRSRGEGDGGDSESVEEHGGLM